MKLIYTNSLKEKMARYSITQVKLAEFLKIDVKRLRGQLKGEVRFKDNEMHAIVAYFNFIPNLY